VATKLDRATEDRVLASQRSEITEYFIYDRLSRSVKDRHNKEVLKRISKDELKHYNIWKGYTGQQIRPRRLKIWLYYLISRIFGITFGLKLMERGEGEAQLNYADIARIIPEAGSLVEDEHEHERELIDLIDEDRLNYIGAIVRGLNEALVELTGALAGLTLAFQEPGLIATAGMITGLAMSLSLAGTEYLATKSEDGHQRPFKAAAYTGLANIITVLFLVFPYFVLPNIFLSLGLMLFNAVVVISLFSFYVSVAREISFRKRFLEMAAIGLGIAALTFAIGFLARIFWHVEV
jgi:VIT1/CCC1 family predicted Fe2+/Mn2+ transporter